MKIPVIALLGGLLATSATVPAGAAVHDALQSTPAAHAEYPGSVSPITPGAPAAVAEEDGYRLAGELKKPRRKLRGGKKPKVGPNAGDGIREHAESPEGTTLRDRAPGLIDGAKRKALGDESDMFQLDLQM